MYAPGPGTSADARRAGSSTRAYIVNDGPPEERSSCTGYAPGPGTGSPDPRPDSEGPTRGAIVNAGPAGGLRADSDWYAQGPGKDAFAASAGSIAFPLRNRPARENAGPSRRCSGSSSAGSRWYAPGPSAAFGEEASRGSARRTPNVNPRFGFRDGFEPRTPPGVVEPSFSGSPPSFSSSPSR